VSVFKDNSLGDLRELFKKSTYNHDFDDKRILFAYGNDYKIIDV